MFSGFKRLGEQQDEEPDADEESRDIDFIATNFLSPSGGYPPQRINTYDEKLAEHQTLNGIGMSRAVAQDTRKYLVALQRPGERTRVGAPATHVTTAPVTAPRTANRFMEFGRPIRSRS